MPKKFLLGLIAAVFTAVMLVSASVSAAEGTRYHLIPVKDGDNTYTYLLDADKGELYEVKIHKTSKGNLEHYLKLIPQFEKDKDLIKWITEIEKSPNQ